MSLVGTRPPTLDEWEKYEPHHRARMSFRPGLTGLWQVSGRSNITDFEEVVRLDTQYMPDINKSEHLHLKKIKEKWIFDSYCRLFLDKLLPEEVEKVLYLDGDVLNIGSLKELWSLDMGESSAAAVIDCLGEKYYELLGLGKNARYCNSGVILFDLDKWRKDCMGDKVRKYVHDNNGYVFFMEQTVFNAVMQGKIKILHPKYNTYSMMQRNSCFFLLRSRKLLHLSD